MSEQLHPELSKAHDHLTYLRAHLQRALITLIRDLANQAEADRRVVNDVLTRPCMAKVSRVSKEARECFADLDRIRARLLGWSGMLQ